MPKNIKEIVEEIKFAEIEGLRFESLYLNEDTEIVIITYTFCTTYGPVKSRTANKAQALLIEMGLDLYSKMSIEFKGDLKQKVDFKFNEKINN